MLEKIINNKPMKYWFCSALIVALGILASNQLNIATFFLFLIPLIACTCLFISLDRFSLTSISYLLFFSISITSILGLTKTLTGSHAESTNIFLYGLSFYTASWAYLLKKNKLSTKQILYTSNPLLLITGPIAILVQNNKRSIAKRVRYYFPFIVLGFFLSQAIAPNLIGTFFLIESTDLISSLIFATIFELFVYSNFCGLSLLVYGISGILGYKIPLNFKQPFSSTNIIDFWKGWHRSLSIVLKELFYRPLKKRFPTEIALIGVYFSSAMWHGVTFNFFLWGIFHTLMFILTLWLLRQNFKFITFPILVFSIIFGRLLFADSDTARLIEKLTFQYDGVSVFTTLMNMPGMTLLSLFFITIFVMSELLFQKFKLFRTRTYKFYRLPIVSCFLLVLTLAMISVNDGSYAVYGQR
jgi:alginate O-acetyltransferase complex protein AlgI